MKRFMLTSAAAVAFAAAPAFAEDTSSAKMPATGDQAPQEQAMQNAEKAGIRDVKDVHGAFVIQGVTADAVPVMMVVSPTGELLALAAPLAAIHAAAAKPAAAGEADASAEQSASGEQMAPDETVEANAGEPAETGYMSTQANPASPNMWDPAAVEAGMKSLELGLRGAAGEVPEPSQ